MLLEFTSGTMFKQRRLKTCIKMKQTCITKIDLLYMIMDLGEAELFGILEEHKKQKDLTVNKIRFFWEEILQCISAVHDKNIIHADVKPENFIRYLTNKPLKGMAPTSLRIAL